MEPHARSLARTTPRTKSLFPVFQREEIAKECDLQSDYADAALQHVKEIVKAQGLGTEHDEDELVEMDKHATKLLRANKVGQQWKNSQRCTILAVSKSQPGSYSAVDQKDRCLNELHRWMFPRL